VEPLKQRPEQEYRVRVLENLASSHLMKPVRLAYRQLSVEDR
jgi:hypothetical protein